MSSESETSVDRLRAFFEESPVARRATSPLKRGAEVGLTFTDVSGDFRFIVEGGRAQVLEARATDPDFELTLAPGAVNRLCALESDDLGEFAVAFFKCLLADDPQNKIGVRLHSGLIKLTRRGYLKTMALGGPKVLLFIARSGFAGPMGIKKAIDKLRRAR